METQGNENQNRSIELNFFEYDSYQGRRIEHVLNIMGNIQDSQDFDFSINILREFDTIKRSYEIEYTTVKEILYKIGYCLDTDTMKWLKGILKCAEDDYFSNTRAIFSNKESSLIVKVLKTIHEKNNDDFRLIPFELMNRYMEYSSTWDYLESFRVIIRNDESARLTFSKALSGELKIGKAIRKIFRENAYHQINDVSDNIIANLGEIFTRFKSPPVESIDIKFIDFNLELSEYIWDNILPYAGNDHSCWQHGGGYELSSLTFNILQSLKCAKIRFYFISEDSSSLMYEKSELNPYIILNDKKYYLFGRLWILSGESGESAYGFNPYFNIKSDYESADKFHSHVYKSYYDFSLQYGYINGDTIYQLTDNPLRIKALTDLKNDSLISRIQNQANLRISLTNSMRGSFQFNEYGEVEVIYIDENKVIYSNWGGGIQVKNR